MKYYFLLISIFILAACSKEHIPDVVTYIPYQSEENGLWGFVNLLGEPIINPILTNKPTYFSNGFALFKKADGYYDFIDENGIIMGKNYKYAAMFSEGLACVTVENKAPVYINQSFEIALELKDCSQTGMFSEGLAKCQNQDGLWGFIDKNGKVVIDYKYIKAKSFSNGLALVNYQDNKKRILRGYIDRNGNEVIRLTDYVAKYRPFSDSLAAFTRGEGWGFINISGFIAIRENPDWNAVTPFKNGFASFRQDGFWGLINKKGDVVLPASYSRPLIFSSGLASAEYEDEWGFIDTKGKFVIAAQFRGPGLPFLGASAYMQTDSGYVALDSKGKIISSALHNICTDYKKFENKEFTVQSDYFDIDVIFTKIINSITKYNISFFSDTLSPQAALGIMELPDSSLKNDLFGNPYINKSSYLNKNIAYVLSVFFDSSNDQTKLGSVIYKIDLFEEAAGKIDNIMNALKKQITAQGFNVKSHSGGWSFSSEKNLIDITKKTNRIELKYRFN